uniref:Uncharacterized protein n=1 Tax=uncultured marine virus TaxID=186617 RepID=A0A0F7L591_9VIRU|nr:hypothetical protein [uncultured marine virus]
MSLISRHILAISNGSNVDPYELAACRIASASWSSSLQSGSSSARVSISLSGLMTRSASAAASARSSATSSRRAALRRCAAVAFFFVCTSIIGSCCYRM